MALTDESNGMVMPVQPMYGGGYGYGNGGGFGFGGDWAWILLLLVLGGGWGGFGMGGMLGAGMWGMDGAFPWILASNANNQNATNAGFDNLAVGNALSGIQSAVTSGFGDTQLGIAGVNQNICQSTGQIQNTLCQGFAGTTSAITGAQNALAQQMYSNQLADLERSFAAQTATTAGMTGIQSQLAQCCCDNRLATESLRATVLSENCQDRYEAANNTRDIIQSQTASTQAILDKLCALELDAKNDKIADLERQLTMANLAASQTAQTARILDNNNAQTAALIADNARQTAILNPTPVPSYSVPNPYTGCCNSYSNCGCNGSF